LIEQEGDPGGILVGRRTGEMGAALAALAADAHTRTRYGKAARQRAEQFGWDPLANTVDSIYRGLLAATTLT
jgi:glycosyltransferase involved in cell wall biosynthesis